MQLKPSPLIRFLLIPLLTLTQQVFADEPMVTATLAVYLDGKKPNETQLISVLDQWEFSKFTQGIDFKPREEKMLVGFTACMRLHRSVDQDKARKHHFLKLTKKLEHYETHTKSQGLTIPNYVEQIEAEIDNIDQYSYRLLCSTPSSDNLDELERLTNTDLVRLREELLEQRKAPLKWPE